jgi:CrcB protein
LKGIEFALLAIGAAAGAMLRYKMASSPIVFGALPLNILLINVMGSFVLGVFSVVSLAWNLDARYSLLIAIGFCGSLTTMSSFALETNGLIENRQFANAAINILSNVGLSIGAVAGGRVLATVLFKGVTGGV